MEGCVVLVFSPKYSTTEAYDSCRGADRADSQTTTWKCLEEQKKTLCKLQADLRRLAVFDQRLQLLTVGPDEFLQHRAVVLHQELLFGHLHSSF